MIAPDTPVRRSAHYQISARAHRDLFVHNDVLEGVKAKEAEGEKRRKPAHRVGHLEGKTG
jgi:hypothetical protein